MYRSPSLPTWRPMTDRQPNGSGRCIACKEYFFKMKKQPAALHHWKRRENLEIYHWRVQQLVISSYKHLLLLLSSHPSSNNLKGTWGKPKSLPEPVSRPCIRQCGKASSKQVFIICRDNMPTSSWNLPVILSNYRRVPWQIGTRKGLTYLSRSTEM
jgi:hypothetical protein